ncbi:hypothetical protein [Rhizobium sp. BK176]|uniref:hypothetical protein n=1 Tax=Rhizobium sp. BK176 TaxID=2587071 RepID=UPI002168A2AA|nr:hypothetical protein [Rhizobium sp. BK176]MCS4088882.1 hypothetical protein [Rhizobium sp. BK176]
MKIRVKCPVIVDVLPAKLKTPRKIVLTTWRSYDLPEPAGEEGTFLAASCETPMAGTPTPVKKVFKTEQGYYTQVSDKSRHYPDGLNVAVPGNVSGELSDRIATRTAAAVDAILRHKTEKFTAPPDGRKPDDLLLLPDVERYDGVVVDLQAYEAQLLAIDEIVKEYAVFGSTLYRKIQEPFYAVSVSGAHSPRGTAPYVGMHLVTDGEPSADTVAVFRLGRRDDALDFVASIEEAGANPGLLIHTHRNFEESPQVASDFADIETTIAIAAKRTLDAFESSFSLFHNRPTDALREAIFDVPLDQLSTARSLRAATQGKDLSEIAVNADRLVELLEDVASYGEESRFTEDILPLLKILSLWENRNIDIDFSSQTRKPTT